MYNESKTIFHPLKDSSSNTNSDHLSQNNPIWDSCIFQPRCLAACSQEKRCSWPDMRLYTSTSQSWFLPLVLYSISFLTEVDCIHSAFWCLISPWQIAEMKAANTSKLHSPPGVAPRCTYTAGLGGLGELCSSQKCVAVYLAVEHRAEVYICSQIQFSWECTGLCYSITLTLVPSCAFVLFISQWTTFLHCEAPYI